MSAGQGTSSRAFTHVEHMGRSHHYPAKQWGPRAAQCWPVAGDIIQLKHIVFRQGVQGQVELGAPADNGQRHCCSGVPPSLLLFDTWSGGGETGIHSRQLTWCASESGWSTTWRACSSPQAVTADLVWVPTGYQVSTTTRLGLTISASLGVGVFLCHRRAGMQQNGKRQQRDTRYNSLTCYR